MRTNHGDVIVTFRAGVSGLSDELIDLAMAEEGAAGEFEMVTPLTAFGAKMVDLIEVAGTHDFELSAAMRELLVREKATHELKRIEQFARRQ